MNPKTEDQEFFFQEVLSQVSRPSRYLGCEVNAVHKDLAQMDVKVVLAFPDLYEVGMSNLGFQILYHVLNSQEKIAAERVFAPWKDLEVILRKWGRPLFSLESRLPLASFDIVGFSIQYELSYTNVLAMLDLGRIPLRSNQRKKTDPLIIAGGFSAFNPEPMADFIDGFVIGEGEEVVLEIIDVYREWRNANRNRSELLTTLASIPGVYIPSRYEKTFPSHQGGLGTTPMELPSEPIKKRTVSDLNRVLYPTNFIVPFSPVIHDRVPLEVARGCTKGCRFCQAGMVYRPVRERAPSEIESIAAQAFCATGLEEMSLLSLNSGDYSAIENLLASLVSRYHHDEVTISLPSLRAETLTPQLLNAVNHYRKFAFTIAPEAGTERLRRIINKGLREPEILEACSRIFAAGWRTIKLYFMIGLPTETKKDLDGIVELAEKVWDQGKSTKIKYGVTVSVSAFIPKPHTPFQWSPMLPAHEIRMRQDYLRKRLKKSKFHFKWQDPDSSIIEAIMARGDRRLGAIIEEAFKKGARFDGWTECFSLPLWEEAFNKFRLDMGTYLRRREPSEFLPWDSIDVGVSKDYLWTEYCNAAGETARTDCRRSGCHHCGVCDFESLYPRIEARGSVVSECVESTRREAPRKAVRRVRLRFAKTKYARFLSHLEMIKVFVRAVRRARVPLLHTSGYHPQPRIAFGPANPVGIASVEEYVDMELWQPLSPETVKTNLNKEFPEGLTILSAKEIPLNARAISDSVKRVWYTIPCHYKPINTRFSREELKARVADFLQAEHRYVVRIRKGSAEKLDVRSGVSDVILAEGELLRVALQYPEAQSIRASDVVAALFSLSQDELRGLPICKTAMILIDS